MINHFFIPYLKANFYNNFKICIAEFNFYMNIEMFLLRVRHCKHNKHHNQIPGLKENTFRYFVLESRGERKEGSLA